MTQSAKIQLVIGAVLLVSLPLVCYLDDRPKEKTARQIAWEERKEKEEREREEQKVKREREEAERRIRDSINYVEIKQRREREEKIERAEHNAEELAKKVEALFKGCDWDIPTVTKEGSVAIGMGSYHYTFTITSVRVKNDNENGLYLECIGTDYCFKGQPILTICSSSDPVFATVLKRFQKAVQDHLLGVEE